MKITIEKLATNVFAFLLIVSTLMSVLTYGYSVNAVFLIASGSFFVMLIGGNAKRLNGKWKGKVIASKAKRAILEKHIQLAYEDMWKTGYRDKHVAGKLTKFKSKVINTK